MDLSLPFVSSFRIHPPPPRLLLFLFFCSLFTTHEAARIVKGQELGRNITHILDSFFETGKYDRRVRPNYGGTPVEVGVSLYILTISSVSEVQMDFTTDFYFRQVWTDGRLAFTETENIKELSVGSEFADKIWVPDTFFANEKSAYFHEATKMNTFLRIGSSGKVYRSIRLTVTANCPMDLQYFPMDRQKCTIEIESYGYSMSDIVYFWKDGERSIGIDESLTLPQFSVAGIKQGDKKIVLGTGNYSRLICEIQLIRSMGYYMIQIYVPASLIVMISWVSFWLHRNATPARVQLGVVTVLTMTTLMSSTNSQLPKISYVKSIDVFLGTCFVMVFAALLEYAAVGYIGKRISMRKNRYQQLAKAAEEKRRKLAIEQQEPMEDMSRSCRQPTSGNTSGNAGEMVLLQQHPTGGGLCNTSMLDSQQQQQQQQSNVSNVGQASGPSIGNSNTQSGDQLAFAMHPLQMSCDQLLLPSQSLQLCSQPPSVPPPPPMYASGCSLNTAPCGNTGAAGQPPTSGHSHHPHHHHVAHYATIRRSVGGSSTTAGASSNTGTAQLLNMNTMAGNRLVHRLQEMRMEMVGSKALAMTAGTSGGPADCGKQAGAMNTASNRSALDTPAHHHQHHRRPHHSSPPKNLNNLFGVSPSDIDKYSRVVFPVCFVCFNLMYWIIFMHISNLLEFDLDGEQ